MANSVLFSTFLTALALMSSSLGRTVSQDAAGPASLPALVDLEGHDIRPLPDPAAQLVVFVFVRTDCPISNTYAPLIARLHTEFALRGVKFWLVYSDSEETADAIQRHVAEFSYPCQALRDLNHVLARQSHVRITPEAALYSANGKLLYHGRIDDRQADFGKSRPQALHHDLQVAITLALAGKPVPLARFPGVGCFIEGAE